MGYFADRFTELCESKGTTPYKVAIELGMSQSTLSQFGTGKRTPNKDHLKRIAESEVLGVSYELLLSWLLEQEIPGFKKMFKMAGNLDDSGKIKSPEQLFDIVEQDITKRKKG